ncbi:MAG: hypothetical protein WAU58_05640 [Terriglobales bacterium]
MKKMHNNTSMKNSHLWVALILSLLLSSAVASRAQTSPVQTPPIIRPSDNDTTRAELANMDRFLDKHPEIAEQLRKDPSLIDNKGFVESHPALAQFLQEHPGVREEFKENPNAFMRAEDRYDRREDRGDNDTTRAELANMDRFFDKHPEIAEQLRKDPSLIDNKGFLENHPALAQFLQEHPGVSEEFKENPNAFMRAEDRYDRREDAGAPHDRDRDRRDLGGFGDFLRGHSAMADQLTKDPTLANNREYLESHPDLRDYLKDHPEVQQQLLKNPQGVMTSPGLVGTAPKVQPPAVKPDLKQ